MKRYSKKWMGTFIDGKLPEDKIIIDTMSRKAFEVESVEVVQDANGEQDSIFEIKVLPNRVADAMSLRGMAREMATLFDLKLHPSFSEKDYSKFQFNNDFLEIQENKKEETVKGVAMRSGKPVFFFSGLKVKFDNSQESPEWIKDILVKSGGRSINLLVDITNLMLYSFGQPAHVFDFEKLEGGKLITRFARDGEEIELLDGKKLKLIGDDYVISDESRALSLAGIKGGKLAEVDKNTKIAIFEMANFNPTIIRRTSSLHNIRTDASKIFENGISTSLTDEMLGILVATIKEIQPTAEIEFVFQEKKVVKKGYKVGLSLDSVRNYAGKNFPIEEVEKLLAKQNFKTEYVVIKEKLLAKINELQIYAKENVVEYKMGASVIGDAPKFFDCSGLMSYLFKESGVQIPRLSIDQLTFGKVIEKKDLIFGDLIFTNEGQGHVWYESLEYKKGEKFEKGVSHVGMYLGDNNVLHISMTDNEIQVINLLDGKKFTEDKIVGYRRMCNIDNSVLIVTPPDERLDIKIEEDVLEEVLRIYGFDNIESKPLNFPENISNNQRFLFENYLKIKLLNKGYTEIFNYTFVPEGKVKVKLGLAQDKEFLRDNLFKGAGEAFVKNYNYLPILEKDVLKFFEIGTVFLNDKKEEKLAIIVCDDNKKKTKYLGEIEDILKEISNELGIGEIEIIQKSEKPASIEFSIDKIVDLLKEKGINIPFVEIEKDLQSIKYSPISVYPSISRDIATWVPENFNFENLQQNLKGLNLENLIKIYKFDEFTKEGKTSIAFRLIFQSYEKTLTDEEVEQEMQKVYSYLKENNFEIR